MYITKYPPQLWTAVDKHLQAHHIKDLKVPDNALTDKRNSLFIYVCPSICVIVAASVCMHVLHVCVPACMRSQQLMMHG